ncbi:MAG: metal-dependent hydrolase [Bacteroidetes bacterium]|nr:metal-dependent hydrolase [Bacteroidota bacterium]
MGALAGSAPDIDAVMNFFISDVDALVMHRGITHSIFTALIFGPLFGWLLWRLYKKREGTFRSWTGLVTINIFFHLFLDTCTVYGTGLLTPFTEHRYAFDTIFVADPLYTLPLIVAFVALLVIHRDRPSRMRWSVFGLGISALYMFFAFVNHNSAINALRKAVDEKGFATSRLIATPTLLNAVLWNVIAKDSSGYWIGYYSIFDSDPTPELFYVPTGNELLNKFENADDIQKLKKFALGYYSVSEQDGEIWFNVLRFGQVNGWQNPKSKFAFSYDLSPGAENSMVVQAGRIEGSKRAVLESMFQRMKGR